MTRDPPSLGRTTLYSHPTAHDDQGRVVDGVTLTDHLRAVARRSAATTPETATTADGRSMRDAVEAVGLLHDVGKATRYFQASLNNGPDPDGPTHHSPIGSCAAWFALRALGYGPTTRVAAHHAVAKHHGRLQDVETYLEQRYLLTDDRLSDVQTQAHDVDEWQAEFARSTFDRATDGRTDWAEFLSLVTDPETLQGELYSDWREWQQVVEDTDDPGAYADLLRFSGTLAYADITHAADPDADRYDRPTTGTTLDPAEVRSYAETLGGDATGAAADFDALRETAQTAVDERTATLDAPPPVSTLDLPTGYGKTLTGLLAATHLRPDGPGRIVYALPYTSIIDQTATVLREMLGVKPTADRYTVHHHLAETATVPDSGDSADDATDVGDLTDEEARRAAMLAESWRDGLVLTTFVQLFESLTGPRREQSMKLPALYQSTVILDEPQTLPLRWWPLVGELIEVLTEAFDARVLLMTATQPRIVEDATALLESETLSALERHHFHGDVPDRVSFEFRQSAVDREPITDYGDPAEEIVAAARSDSGAAVLAVCNTIGSARELTDAVADADAATVDVADRYRALLERYDGPPGAPPTDERTEDAAGNHQSDESESEADEQRRAFVSELVDASEDGPLLLHLTTRLRPCDRQFLLAIAADLTERSVPLVVVSTQLIEAGVDVSFDRVYRDFAPLDSIVQAAGRCNRSFADDQGAVTVWQLGPPEGSSRPPGEHIYARSDAGADMDLLTPTQTALADADVGAGDVVPERRVTGPAVDRYHELVGKRVAAIREDDDLVKELRRGQAGSLGQRSLIDHDLSVEVYVCRTAADRVAIDRLRTALDERAYDRVDEYRDAVAPLRVSVPVYKRGSSAEQTLTDLPPLDPTVDDDTERVLGIEDRHHEAFDDRDGLQMDELGVQTRLL